MAPRFLTLEQVLELHAELIRVYGGDAGLRDAGLLASAVEQPRAMFDGRYLHGDVFEMASAYLYHLVMNHAFVDGNKRIGAAGAVVFLAINDYMLEADEDELADLTIGVARGLIGKPEIARFLRGRCVHCAPPASGPAPGTC